MAKKVFNYGSLLGFTLSLGGLCYMLFMLVSQREAKIAQQEKAGALKTAYNIANNLDTSYSSTEESNFTRTDALDDPYGRISKDFKVPKNLRYRTAFWFDVYTKYDKYTHVIHHSKYPWLVIKVIDIKPFLKTRGPKWLRVQRGLNHVKAEKRKIRRALKTLSKRRSFRRLNATERLVYKKLRDIRGPRRTVFKNSISKVRVQLGQKEFFQAGLKNYGKYISTMESIFLNNDLPVELTRLPFVESSFNEKAYSKVGASGIWQIMPKTARPHLIVNKNIDERNSPIKATFMAVKIFKGYHRYFKRWPLTLTAYNNGIGNLSKASKRTKTKNLGKIISRYQGKGAFGFAGSNFFTGFLAALHAEKYHREIFNSKRIEYTPNMNKLPTRLAKKMRFKDLVKKFNIPKKELLSYNLDLRESAKNNAYLPKGFLIFLPPKQEEQIVDKKNKVKDFSRNSLKPKTTSI